MTHRDTIQMGLADSYGDHYRDKHDDLQAAADRRQDRELKRRAWGRRSRAPMAYQQRAAGGGRV